MDTKHWWQSKTFLFAGVLALLGLMHYYKTGDLIKAMELIATAGGLIGLRTGNKSIE